MRDCSYWRALRREAEVGATECSRREFVAEGQRSCCYWKLCQPVQPQTHNRCGLRDGLFDMNVDHPTTCSSASDLSTHSPSPCLKRASLLSQSEQVGGWVGVYIHQRIEEVWVATQSLVAGDPFASWYYEFRGCRQIFLAQRTNTVTTLQVHQ